MIFDLALIAFFILCSSFFSGSETGLTAAARSRIYRLRMEGNRRAEMVSRLRERKEELIGTILLGNNLVNIWASALATSVAIQYYGENALAFVTVAMTLLVLIFGEVLPKTYAIQNPERVALGVAPIVLVLVRLFSPVTLCVQWFIKKLLRLFGVDITKENTLISATDAVRGAIELYHSEGEMVKQERDMLGSILDLGSISVEEIMVHRKGIETINAALPANEIVRRALNSSHTRLPLWRENPDNIIGLLHVRDLMNLIAEHGSRHVTSEMIMASLSRPWFIPNTTTLREQLVAFRGQRSHFAHVVDEYGMFQGIVTLEDIIEEIVGEIDDEFDRIKSSGIVKLEDGQAEEYVISGTVTLRDLNRELDWNLPGTDATTLAGLIIHESRTIPETGAVFLFYGFRFTILEKRANQLLRIKVCRLQHGDLGE